MNPAVSSRKKAVILGALVGGFVFWWYFLPFLWLGAVMGLLVGFATFYILSTGRMERLRRPFFIALFVFMSLTLVTNFLFFGSTTFIHWVETWNPGYYFESSGGSGIISYPIPIIIPSIFWRGAEFVAGLSEWQVVLPTTLGVSLALMIPYALIFIVFGKAACGWLCPLGGLPEVMSSGKKERWQLNFFRKKTVTPSGFIYTGLKGWVNNVKYVFLLVVFLLSIFLGFAIINIFFPVLWLKSIPAFWTIIGILVVFAVILPFMTKRRWWCFICPVGALLSSLKKISLFRVKIDKEKCIKCMDCVQECPVYAITPQSVEEGKCLSEYCIRCGRCIEVCPDEAIDIYWMGRQKKVRAQFVALVTATAFALYIWFVVLFVSYFSRIGDFRWLS